MIRPPAFDRDPQACSRCKGRGEVENETAGGSLELCPRCEGTGREFIYTFTDQAVERATKWQTFVLLRTVIEQSTSSLRSEALIKLAELEARVRDAEALGDL